MPLLCAMGIYEHGGRIVLQLLNSRVLAIMLPTPQMSVNGNMQTNVFLSQLAYEVRAHLGYVLAQSSNMMPTSGQGVSQRKARKTIAGVLRELPSGGKKRGRILSPACLPITRARVT